MYLSLHLQNHIGFEFRTSWRVAKKISKLPSWRGLQKNHAQLQFYKGFPCKLKVVWVWVWQNLKITLVRGHQVSQSQPTNQSTNQPTNQPTNQTTNQPTNQPINRPTKQPTNRRTNPHVETLGLKKTFSYLAEEYTSSRSRDISFSFETDCGY